MKLLNWDYIKVKLSKQISKTLFNCINKLNKNMYMEIKEEISDKVYEDLFNFLIKDITDNPTLYRDKISSNLNALSLYEKFDIKSKTIELSNSLDTSLDPSNPSNIIIKSLSIWDAILNPKLQSQEYSIGYEEYYGGGLPLISKRFKYTSLISLIKGLDDLYNEYYEKQIKQKNIDGIIGICNIKLSYHYMFMGSTDMVVHRVHKDSTSKLHSIDSFLHIKDTILKFVEDFPEVEY